MKVNVTDLLEKQDYYLYNYDGYVAHYVLDDKRAIVGSKFLDHRMNSLSELQSFKLKREQLPSKLYQPSGKGNIQGFIFHMGHVGSTMVANALGTAESTICLKEPLPLRYLAAEFIAIQDNRSFLGYDKYTSDFNFVINHIKRPYFEKNQVVIKCTSGVLEIAEQLLAQCHVPSVFLYMKPERFIANILREGGGRTDLLGRVTNSLRRLNRLQSFKYVCPTGLTIGEKAAILWLADFMTASRLTANPQYNLKLVDFDAVLDDWDQSLSQIASQFNLVDYGHSAELELVRSSYSKRIENVSFSSADREIIINEAMQLYKSEISLGIKFLKKWLAVVPELEAQLEC